MFEFTEEQPPFEVQESEYIRLLGFPRRHALDGRARELGDWARQWYADHGRPWIFARWTPEVSLGPETVSISGTQFSSRRLRASFAEAKAQQAVLVAVSAGAECERHARRCWEEEKPDEYFFLEIFGSAVVESLITRAAGRICAWAEQHGLAALPRYSPGYAGWPVSDQAQLWSTFRANNGKALPGELEVLPSGMLRPKKSLLAVIGLTGRMERVPSGSHLVPCTHCSLPHCQYRRAAYRYAPPNVPHAIL